MINKSIYTPTEGRALVAEFYKSGLKPGQFCKQKNISYYTLQYWRDKNIVKNNNLQSNNAEFLPIKFEQKKSTSDYIKIRINQKINIELSSDIDLSLFKKILEVCIACG